MRTSMLTAAILVGAWTMPALDRAVPIDMGAVATVAAQEPAAEPSSPPPSQPSSQPSTSEPRSAQPPSDSRPVNVQVSNRWHFSPVWTAIGVIGAVLVVMLIVMASKSGGSNTVIRG